MKQFTVNPDKTYAYSKVEPKNAANRQHSGYARVTNKHYNQPVPQMEWVEGTFQLAK